MYILIIKSKFLIFTLVTVICFFLERISPSRAEFHKLFRVTHNYLLVLANNCLIYILTIIWGFNLVLAGDQFEFGILRFLEVQGITNIIITVLVMDLVIYFQHRYFHKNNYLWKFHAVHHYDTELDFSTGIRFHPIEIIISFFIKLMTILILGAQGMSVFWFELILMSSAMFNHSNIHISKFWDLKTLRRFIVTPGMHTIHHSKKNVEMNSNYGFFLSFWDRIFKTYKPKYDETIQFDIGLRNVGFESQHVLQMLKFPWNNK